MVFKLSHSSCPRSTCRRPVLLARDLKLRSRPGTSESYSAFRRALFRSRYGQNWLTLRECSSLCCNSAVTATDIPSKDSQSESSSNESEIVVVGSGIGGLCCASLLAKYGYSVTVCESHDTPGGCAHSWKHPKGYHFESGPSLYSGMAGTGPSGNPLAHVFQAIGEPLELIQYDTWNVFLPEGEFLTKVGAENFCEVLQSVRGDGAVREWRNLQEHMRPFAEASAMLPPMAMRADAGVLRTAILRYWRSILRNGSNASKLTGPFSNIIEGVVKDPFIRNWLDLLSFMLSGLPCNGTIAAEVAFMFNEWYRPDCHLEFPKGGSGAMVGALVRGLEKFGGRLMLDAHVEEILVEGGRAAGVRLRGGQTIRASKAVVSNATIWDTLKLLPKEAVPKELAAASQEMPMCRSFMHLHLGFDAKGLPEDLEMHHIVVNSWEGGVDTEQNVVLICIASVIDPDLAPEGKHVLHAYTPATEPYELWEGLKRNSPEYKKLKEERSQVLWRAVERVIPDIRERVEVELVGTPLTHERFNRRHRGTYGPAVVAGTGLLPGPKSPVPGLMCCGDTTFPGIGLPATAASGSLVANTLASVEAHSETLSAIGL
uniref:Carotene isomerase n=1 Tax=Tetraselmis sp. GSL018 TaxID=582737 RepID=A0A061RCQ2_9CHLO